MTTKSRDGELSILEELEKAEAVATQGPWQGSVGLSGVVLRSNYDASFQCTPGDANLICLMRNNIKTLLECARALEWYADWDHWSIDWVEGSHGDYGGRARDAIKKLEKVK